MLRTQAQVVLLALAASVGLASSASAAVLMPAKAAILANENQATPVTFWAQAYPYRYVPRRSRCPRVRVETPYGWYWDRACVAAGEPALRRAY